MHCALHSIRRFGAALLLAALALSGAATAYADGPVTAGGVPGGAVAITGDDDALTGPDAGERWGRLGGRTITYTLGNTSALGSLQFGVVAGTVPTVAFDNSLTPNTNEYMTYDQTSNLAGGIARWHGAGQLQLLTGMQTFNTRFTLTVTTVANNPVPLTFVNGGVSPGSNVLASGSFKANLYFEMQVNGVWGPLLTTYDNLPNKISGSPNPPGPVLSGVSTGFYFTGAGMTIAQHDAHITALLGDLQGDVDFLTTDAINRLKGIGTEVATIRGAVVNSIPSTLQEILGKLSGGQNSNAATRSDVESARNDLQNIMLILWGLMPCPPEAGPLCTMAKFIKDLSTQASVDLANGKLTDVLSGLTGISGGVGGVQTSINAMQGKLDALQAAANACSGSLRVETSQVSMNDKQRRWIVKTTRDGALVNASVSVVSVAAPKAGPASAQNVSGQATVASLGTGLHDVSLNVVKGVSDGAVYVFQASLAAGACTLQGSVMVEPENNGVDD